MMELDGSFSCMLSGQLLFVRTTKMNEALYLPFKSGIREGKKSTNMWFREGKVTSTSSKEEMGIKEGVMVNFMST